MAKSKDPRSKELISGELEYVRGCYDRAIVSQQRMEQNLQTIADILRPYLDIPTVSCNCAGYDE